MDVDAYFCRPGVTTWQCYALSVWFCFCRGSSGGFHVCPHMYAYMLRYPSAYGSKVVKRN